MSLKIEHIIRDWLVANPDFIEQGLQLVEKEHYLPDGIGSSGFIDILCKDVYNNFVIIEIKRSDSAARQTFTEVLKYAELIKNTYNARTSEIRIIIVSTHWDEILRAFSNICFSSSFAIKGLQIYINEQTKIPVSKEEVIPVSSRAFSRKFMTTQILYLFHSPEKREKAHKVLNQKLCKAKVYDYASVDLKAPVDKHIPYPCAINVAFQKISTKELLNSISLMEGERHIDMVEEDFENKEEYLNYLEQAFIASLKMGSYVDTVEVGYSEKFESIIGAQNWKISSIYRYGIFNKDPRYSEELLIKELKGHDGSSFNKFVGFSESTQKERLKELRVGSQRCLNHTPQWAECIDHVLSSLEKSKEKFKVLIDIYNPDSIVKSLYFTLIKSNPDYLPLFLVFVNYVDTNTTIVYRGEINGIGIKPTSKLFTSTRNNKVSDEIFRIELMPDNILDALRMGLKYTITKTVLVNDEEMSNQFVQLDENDIVSDPNKYTSIENYIINNQKALSIMINHYGSFYHQT